MIKFKQYISENFKDLESDEVLYPGGVYISVKMQLESTIAVSNYMKKYLPNCNVLKPEDMHCTLIYSKKEQKGPVQTKEYEAVATFLHFNKFDDGNVLVAEIKSDTLVRRNKELTEEYNFVSDFDEYRPHFTLSYEAKDIDINSLPPMDFAMYFDSESVEELDENWENKNDDETVSTTDGTLVGKALAQLNKDKEDKKDKENKEDRENKENKEDKGKDE